MVMLLLIYYNTIFLGVKWYKRMHHTMTRIQRRTQTYTHPHSHYVRVYTIPTIYYSWNFV